MNLRLTVRALAMWLAVYIAPGAELKLPKAFQNAFRMGGPPASSAASGVDKEGNRYFAGSFVGVLERVTGFPVENKQLFGPPSGVPRFYVAKVSANGDQLLYLAEFRSSSTDDWARAMAVASDGSVFLAGTTRAADFPTTAGSFQPASKQGGAFLLKLDPAGKNLVYSTFLGDSPATSVFALDVDRAGNAYVGGYTNGEGFPTTPGSYQPKLPEGAPRPASLGFLSKISATGSVLLASTLLPEGEVLDLAVAPNGTAHIAGPRYTLGIDASAAKLVYIRPVAQEWHSPLIGVDGVGNVYVARKSTLSELSELRKLDANGRDVFVKEIAGASFYALRISEDGKVFAGGSTHWVGFATRDTLQPCNMNLPHDSVPVQWWVNSAIFMQFDAAGGTVHASLLGGGAPEGHGNDGNTVSGIDLGADGSVYLHGGTTSRDFPGGPMLIPGSSTGFLFGLKLDLTNIDRGQPSAACLAVAAAAESPLMPVTVMTVFGSHLGPARGVNASLGPDGRFPAELAGVRVKVGGTAAPVLYVQEDRVDFVAPASLVGSTADVCLSTARGETCLFAYVGNVLPRLFANKDGYVVLNQDGTLNTRDNRAASASTVTVFGTGFGSLDRTLPDGSLSSPPLGWLANSIRARVTQQPAPPRGPQPPDQAGEVVYAGAAPGQVQGVTQINVRLPGTFPGGIGVVLTVDGGTVPRYRQPIAFGVWVK